LEHNTGVVFGPDAGLEAPLNGSTVTITTDMLQVTDVDSPTQNRTYTLTEIPDISQGYLINTAEGKALPIDYSFTQADIDSDKIQYVSLVGGDYVTDFKFIVKDGGVRILPD